MANGVLAALGLFSYGFGVSEREQGGITMAKIKTCPMPGKIHCNNEECAWWVSSSRMCTVKDLAHSVKVRNTILFKAYHEIESPKPEHKTCRCKYCVGTCLCNKFCPEYENCEIKGEGCIGCPEMKREGAE